MDPSTNKPGIDVRAQANRVILRLGLAALAVSILWELGFTLFSSDEPDDTHITYWEAFTTAKFGAIINYNGSPLETSSSLAHAALVALVHRLTGIEIPTAGVLVPAVFGALAVLLGSALTLRVAPRFAAVGALLIATTPWLLYWVFGGLDAPIAAAALVALVLASSECVDRPSWRSFVGGGVAIALIVTARPEGSLVAFATLLGAAALGVAPALRRQRLPAHLAPYAMLLALTFCETTVLLAYRKLTFHTWMPNAVYAKVETIRAGDGAAYIARHTGVCASWILIGVVVALGIQVRRIWRTSPSPAPAPGPSEAATNLAVCACLATIGFVVASGGDWMFRGRFLVPLAAVGVPTALAAIDRLAPRSSDPRRETVLVVAVSLLGLLLNAGASFELAGPTTVAVTAATRRERVRSLAARFPLHRYSFFEVGSKKHLREIYIEEALDTVIEALEPLGRPIVVATKQAGFVPYHLAKNHFGAVHIVDTLSLATDDVRRCAPDLIHRLADAAKEPQNGFAYATGVSYKELLEQREIFGRCGLIPDVIYDLGTPGKKMLNDYGYEIVYKQIENKTGKYQAFIAMKEELVETYGVEARFMRR